MERLRWKNEVTSPYSCLACVAGDEKENNEKGLGATEKDACAKKPLLFISDRPYKNQRNQCDLVSKALEDQNYSE